MLIGVLSLSPNRSMTVAMMPQRRLVKESPTRSIESLLLVSTPSVVVGLLVAITIPIHHERESSILNSR